MDTSETPDAKALETTVLQTVLGDMCAFVIPKTFLTHEEMIFSTYRDVLPIVTQKQRGHMRSTQLLPKRLSIA